MSSWLSARRGNLSMPRLRNTAGPQDSARPHNSQRTYRETRKRPQSARVSTRLRTHSCGWVRETPVPPEQHATCPAAKPPEEQTGPLQLLPAERWPGSFRGSICSSEKIRNRLVWLRSRRRICRCGWRQPGANHASSIAESGTIERLRRRPKRLERCRGSRASAVAAALGELQAELRLPALLEAPAVQSW